MCASGMRGAILPDGTRVYVGAASYDNVLDRTLLHHISADIGAERDQLTQDMTATGAAQAQTSIQMAGARVGTSVAGDPWFTNGMAAVLRVQ